jgi:hypothetical protein
MPLDLRCASDATRLPRSRARRALLIGLVAVVGCGRFGYGEDGDGAPVALVAEEVIAPTPFGLTARADGEGYAAASAYLGPDDSNIRIAIVETDGAGRPDGGPMFVGDADGWLSYIEVFTTSEGYRVFFRENDSNLLRTIHVNDAGEVLDDRELGDRIDATVAATSAGYAVAYAVANASSYQELTLQLYDDGVTALGSPIAPVPATAHHRLPHVAQSGDGYGFIWLDAGDEHVFFVSIDMAGATRAAPIDLGPRRPREILADGSGGFVVAHTGSGESTRVMRVDSTGAEVWSAPQLLPTNVRESQDFGMAVTAEHVGFAWQSDDLTPIAAIDGAILSLADGFVVVERHPLSDPIGGACCPAVASDGRRFGTVFDQTIHNRRGAFMQVFEP